VAFDGVQPRTSPLRNWKHLMRACTYADLVTVTTTNLARKYGRGNNARVLPNYVPTHALASKPLRHPRGERPLRFTWTGSVATHPTDLQVATAGFQQLVLHGDAECWVVGTGKGVASRLGLGNDEVERAVDVVPDSGSPPEVVVEMVPNPIVHASGEWVPIDQYPTMVNKYTDVGVVPLDDIPFNRGKSWLKGLEFAAAGRPFVASSTEPYLELHHGYGLGLMAAKPRDWVKQMRRLHDDADLAEELAATGLETVRTRMTYEENAHRWAEVYLEAATMRRPPVSLLVDEGVKKVAGYVPFSQELYDDVAPLREAEQALRRRMMEGEL
jgi:glycosyltransferase involved in cell wall biosynthesis